MTLQSPFGSCRCYFFCIHTIPQTNHNRESPRHVGNSILVNYRRAISIQHPGKNGDNVFLWIIPPSQVQEIDLPFDLGLSTLIFPCNRAYLHTWLINLMSPPSHLKLTFIKPFHRFLRHPYHCEYLSEKERLPEKLDFWSICWNRPYLSSLMI